MLVAEAHGRRAEGRRLRRPAVIGGILVGLGLGIFLDDFFAWLVIGIGAGFILMGFIAALGK